MCLQNWAHIATIATPIITIVTIIYIILTFNKQKEANQINTDSLLKVSFESNYDRIYKLILEFENNLKPAYSRFYELKTVSVHKSLIEYFIDSFHSSNDHENFLRSYHFNNLYFIVTQFDNTLDFIESSNLNKNLKEYCLNNLTNLYFNKLSTPITRLGEFYTNDNMYFDGQEIKETYTPKKLIDIMLEIHAKFNKLVINHEL